MQTSNRATVRISVEGSNVVRRDNYNDRQVLAGYEACEEYSVSDARVNCANGYQKRSQEQYRIVNYTIRGNVVQGAQWVNGTTNLQSRAKSPNGNRRTVSRRTLYFCTPSPASDGSHGCRGAPIYETEEGNTGGLSGNFNLSVAYTPAEQQAETNRLANELAKQEERDAETQRLQDLQDQRDLDAAEQRRLDGLQAIADQLSKINQQGGTANTGQYTGDEARENSQDTKYRIISPPGFEIIAGKKVPRIQYESVRFLSPESVSSYVSRGYVVESTNPNTPTSTSKPYGNSILARSKILAPVASFKSDTRRKRVSLADYTHNTGRPPTQGGVQKRTNSRRTIS